MPTILQTYQATIAFLDSWYFRNYSDALGSFLGDTQLMKNYSDWNENPHTLDEQIWHNWMLAVSKILHRPVTFDDVLTDQQGFEALKCFLILYMAKVSSQELQVIYQDLEKITETSSLWPLWLLCLKKAKNNQLDFVSDSLIGRSTHINLHQAIIIIHYFVQHQLSDQIEITHLFQNLQHIDNTMSSDTWMMIALEKAYQKYGFQLHDNVTALNLFKIFVEVLLQYGQKFQLHSILDLVHQYEYSDSGQPKDYMVYYHWLRSFHETLYSAALDIAA